MACNDENIIYQGDDTSAFGGHFIKVNEPTNLGNHTITKLVIECGSLKWIYENPTFPFYIDPNAEETKQFQSSNTAYMKAWDENGKCKTFKGALTFYSESQVVF